MTHTEMVESFAVRLESLISEARKVVDGDWEGKESRSAIDFLVRVGESVADGGCGFTAGGMWCIGGFVAAGDGSYWCPKCSGEKYDKMIAGIRPA